VHKNIVHDFAYAVAERLCSVGVSNTQRLHDIMAGCRNTCTAIHDSDVNKSSRRIAPLEFLWKRSSDRLEKVHSLELLVPMGYENPVLRARIAKQVIFQKSNQDGDRQCLDPP
jgi:hypothetical protein